MAKLTPLFFLIFAVASLRGGYYKISGVLFALVGLSYITVN